VAGERPVPPPKACASYRFQRRVAIRVRIDEHRPISEYAAVGNLRTTLLVDADGSVDWACLPELDAPSVFAALLDRRRGGRFAVGIAGGRSTQRYRDDTNVLETRLESASGRLCIVDFMPLVGPLSRPARCRTAPELHRVLVCEEGEAEVAAVWAPRLDYARGITRIAARERGFVAERGDARLGLAASGGTAELRDDGDGPAVHHAVRLRKGERAVLVTGWGGVPRAEVGRSSELLEKTAASWRAWVEEGRRAGRSWAQPHEPLVTRSELAMKLLVHPDSGAIAAAATTSLPEWIGSVRNWDYRFAWLRDTSLTAQALLALGHPQEAHAFLTWAEEVASLRESPEHALQILHPLRGESDGEEHELEHLEGYRGSRPVRIGNAARHQVQHDALGEILSAAHELTRRGEDVAPALGTFLGTVADAACAHWRRPDSGIWELRTEPRHFVHSKLMCWVALDRALRLPRGGLRGDVRRWAAERDAIARAILEEGFDPEVGAFVQYFGAKHVDAANLLIPVHGLLPFDDPRVLGTLARVERDLSAGELTWRYDAEDGLPGPEGAFGLATYWRAVNLAGCGRTEEAKELVEAMNRHANHVGLLAEQYAADGAALGNFPQAFTHIGVVNASLYVAHAEGRHRGVPPLGMSGVDGSASS
jgi:GH15 family glucan-1,4-alpha-glucosidase